MQPPAPPHRAEASAPSPPSHWQHRLVRAWQSRNALTRTLWPLSLLARVLWQARLAWHALARRLLALPPRRPNPDAAASLPWIVVGNVVVGGAGKTPVTIALVQHWLRQGRQVGVVSKGHGRQRPAHDEPRLVHAHSDARHCGDEPLLIHRRTQAPVAVGPSRQATAAHLLRHHPELELIVCDDGLQDPSIEPTVALIVFDERGVGNGWMLPAGPLRQPWPPRLAAANQLALLTASDAAAPPLPPGLPLHRATRRLHTHAHNPAGRHQLLSALAQPPSGKTPVAAAGIAQPQRFFAMLRQAGIPLAHAHAWADHQPMDSHFCSSIRWMEKRHRIFLTEKDAVKLFPLLQQSGAADLDIWAVPLELELPPSLLAALDARLPPPAATIAPHGPQAA